ncbi:PepSY domain-containing protein [Bacillus taeanensis]|uniref:Uncharacterized protein n=1 Tax=Bacillus taeanensis TaxID=273032 RepID=A0A366XRC3_9BACI|nr:PepSY domain-containing protein [Bacillus taeanensis]RBW68078.1 hypothetical protein DS031_18550 [Bacillus taeanensis]
MRRKFILTFACIFLLLPVGKVVISFIGKISEEQAITIAKEHVKPETLEIIKVEHKPKVEQYWVYYRKPDKCEEGALQIHEISGAVNGITTTAVPINQCDQEKQ